MYYAIETYGIGIFCLASLLMFALAFLHHAIVDLIQRREERGRKVKMFLDGGTIS